MDTSLATVIITALASIFVAILTSFGTWWATRSKTRTDIQSTINAGFERLIAELQEERASLLQEVRTLRAENTSMGKKIVSLDLHIEILIGMLRQHGIKLPPEFLERHGD